VTKVLIVYATDYGNTKKMAEAVASGVTSVPDVQVELKLAEEATADDLIASDALIVGTPVHMGSPDWRVKKWSKLA
jgi:NAD(P)H dehydrogenase (quinone)